MGIGTEIGRVRKRGGVTWFEKRIGLSAAWVEMEWGIFFHSGVGGGGVFKREETSILGVVWRWETGFMGY